MKITGARHTFATPLPHWLSRLASLAKEFHFEVHISTRGFQGNNYQSKVTLSRPDSGDEEINLTSHNDLISFLALTKLVFGYDFSGRDKLFYTMNQAPADISARDFWQEVYAMAWSGEISLFKSRELFSQFKKMFEGFGAVMPPTRFIVSGDEHPGFFVGKRSGQFIETSSHDETIAVLAAYHDPAKSRFGCEIDIMEMRHHFRLRHADVIQQMIDLEP